MNEVRYLLIFSFYKPDEYDNYDLYKGKDHIDDYAYGFNTEKYRDLDYFVELIQGYSFLEAVKYCKSKGSFVGLPSSNDNLESYLRDHPGGTWLGLSKLSYRAIENRQN